MSAAKRAIRERLRRAAYARDGGCVACDHGQAPFDCHHITPREQMPNGGYVLENVVTVCSPCHEKAEACLHGATIPGYSPDELYLLIDSSHAIATAAAIEQSP